MYVSFIIMYTFGQTCFKCQGNNHYAKMCLDSKKPKDLNPQKLHHVKRID